jgi:glycosyltransferase involved in cell wall biosynthesis
MSVCTIIPAYNAEAFLHKALDSVLSQTAPVDEIIVVDDGSKDATCAVVESYAPRVRLIRQKNQGPAAARNLGVKSSTAAFISFLDADDAWQPQKVEKQLAAFAQTPGAVLCYTGVTHVHTDGGWQEDFPAQPIDTLRAELRIGNPRLVPSCVMVSREAFVKAGGFDTALKGSEDWDFAIALQELGPFCMVDEPLCLYQVSDNSLSANPDWMFQETRKMLDRRLLNGLRGPARWLWRHRILSFHAYAAGLGARAVAHHDATHHDRNRNNGVQHDKELRYMLYSLALWPSPLWHPVRFKALAVTLKNKLF